MKKKYLYITAIAISGVFIYAQYLAEALGKRYGHASLFKLMWLVSLLTFIFILVKVIVPWMDKRLK